MRSKTVASMAAAVILFPAIAHSQPALGHRPVCHPCSSNRTCRFPASGFSAGFTARHATWPRGASVGGSDGRGINHPDDLETARNDVRANRIFTPQRPPFLLRGLLRILYGFDRMMELSDCAPSAVGAPRSLMGVPRDTIRVLAPEEIRNAQTPHCAIARDPELLQYLPADFFNTPEGKAALERVARYDNAKYTEFAGGKAALADRLLSLLPIRTGGYSPQQLHRERTGTNKRIDMYPGMIWRYRRQMRVRSSTCISVTKA